MLSDGCAAAPQAQGTAGSSSVAPGAPQRRRPRKKSPEQIKKKKERAKQRRELRRQQDKLQEQTSARPKRALNGRRLRAMSPVEAAFNLQAKRATKKAFVGRLDPKPKGKPRAYRLDEMTGRFGFARMCWDGR